MYSFLITFVPLFLLDWIRSGMSGAHLDEWQRRSFDISFGNCTPEQTADAYRAHILSIQYAWANSLLSQASMAGLFRTYSERYVNVIDTDDLRTGLNNYAESALHLARSQRNHSDKWESFLTMENVLPWVQKKRQAGETHSQVAPEDVNICVGQKSKNKLDAPLLKTLGPPQPKAEVKFTTNSLTNITSARSKVCEGTLSNSSSLSQGKSVCSAPPQKNPDNAGETQNYKFSNFSTSNPSKRKNFYSQDGEVGKGHSGFQAGTDFSAGTNFKTAREQFIADQQKKHSSQQGQSTGVSVTIKKSLGANRSRGASSKFVSPLPRQEEEESGKTSNSNQEFQILNKQLKNFEPKIIELIMSEIMDHGPPVAWDDIAGLEFAKTTIKEIVVWPMLRPDIFTGLRGPPKGILLFGPPGTGKTLIGKCIACQSGATFFSISASSLTSKWVGEGEKMVRALFAIARCHQPAVIFIDEIDSLLSQRTDGEHDSSRRIKTEFLVQLDGAATAAEDRVLVVGATNRPQEIDEAARRRLAKRLYIPLPEAAARLQIVTNLMAQEKNQLREQELYSVVTATQGFSGADMTQLCREAALGPIRSIQLGDITTITAEQVRPILYSDFQEALNTVRSSVSSKDLELYEEWNKTFGSGR